MNNIQKCKGRCQKELDFNKENFRWYPNSKSYSKKCKLCVACDILEKKNISIEAVINEYKILKNFKKVAKKYKCSMDAIYQILKHNNEIPNRRKYFFNEKYFDTLTAESAYWLGFISADGCICKNRIIIELKLFDKLHLKKFMKIINHKGKITKVFKENSKINPRYNDTWNCKVDINSIYMVTILKKYGVMSNKSLKYKIVQNILKSKYLNHFIRGYFDGDGGLHIKKRDGQTLIHFRGTKQTLKEISKIFNKNCDTIKNKKIIFNNGMYKLQYDGNNISSRILLWLYKNSTSKTRLNRKYNLAIEKKLI